MTTSPAPGCCSNCGKPSATRDDLQRWFDAKLPVSVTQMRAVATPAQLAWIDAICWFVNPDACREPLAWALHAPKAAP